MYKQFFYKNLTFVLGAILSLMNEAHVGYTHLRALSQNLNESHD